MKEGSRVVITIELLDRSADDARLAACKGYVNGFAGGMQEEGWTLDKSTVPDVSTLNVKKPIDLDLVFTNTKGEKLLVWKRMFFTSKGFDINVVALNEADLEKLSNWAKKVRPVVAK